MASRRTSGNVTGEVDRVDIRLVDVSWGKSERKPHRSIDAKKGSWYGFETIMKSILSIHDINEKCPSLGTPHCIAMITLQMFLELIEL